MTDLLKIAGKLATMEEVSAVNIGIEGLRNDLKDINKKLNELEPHSRETEERLDFIEEEINKMNPQRLTRSWEHVRLLVR